MYYVIFWKLNKYIKDKKRKGLSVNENVSENNLSLALVLGRRMKDGKAK